MFPSAPDQSTKKLFSPAVTAFSLVLPRCDLKPEINVDLKVVALFGTSRKPKDFPPYQQVQIAEKELKSKRIDSRNYRYFFITVSG